MRYSISVSSAKKKTICSSSLSPAAFTNRTKETYGVGTVRLHSILFQDCLLHDQNPLPTVNIITYVLEFADLQQKNYSASEDPKQKLSLNGDSKALLWRPNLLVLACYEHGHDAYKLQLGPWHWLQ
uniref:Cyclin IaZm n=1 Tax=Arundo donax TaxID=35708 RepID=A0A0A9CZV9_ARUDO